MSVNPVSSIPDRCRRLARATAQAGSGAPACPPVQARPMPSPASPCRHRRSPASVLSLSEAQYVIARELGFASWPKLVASLTPRFPTRTRREGDRVWLDGVPNLRWGSSPEPTYLGALEAAFRSSDRPLDLTSLMGDSGLCFRLRWATRDGGNSWCGSGPAGEWPDEVSALNRATGYVFGWGPQREGAGWLESLQRRVVESIDRGWPILGFGAQMDMAVVYGYEAEGARVLLSDYWASDDPSVMPIGEAKEIGLFIEQIQEPAPRTDAVRAGLALAVKRWHEGVIDPDPSSGATYFYGAGRVRAVARRSRAVRRPRRGPTSQPVLPEQLDVQLAPPEPERSRGAVPARRRPRHGRRPRARGGRRVLRPHGRSTRSLGSGRPSFRVRQAAADRVLDGRRPRRRRPQRSPICCALDTEAMSHIEEALATL